MSLFLKIRKLQLQSDLDYTQAIFCSDEDKFCYCSGSIVYGATLGNTIDLTRGHAEQIVPSWSAGLDCSNSVFGDPLIRVKKSCFCISNNTENFTEPDIEGETLVIPEFDIDQCDPTQLDLEQCADQKAKD